MEIKLFLKGDCDECPRALAACKDFEDITVFDLTRFDGMAEAAIHAVVEAPSVVVLDSDGREIAAWRGAVPDRERLRSLLAN